MNKIEYTVNIIHRKDGIFEFNIDGVGTSDSEREMIINDLLEITDMLEDGSVETEFLQ